MLITFFRFVLFQTVIECKDNQVVIKSGLVSLAPSQIFDFSWYVPDEERGGENKKEKRRKGKDKKKKRNN